MDKLQKCAKAFEQLLEIQYRIIIGRKGKSTELVIGFSKLDFHHLIGLGKLKDLRIAKRNRGLVFDEILNGSTTYKTLTESRYLPQIENRFEPLSLIVWLLDDNRLIFRYNEKLNQFSLKEADYILSTPFDTTDIYIFIAEHKETGRYFCRSFSQKEKKDYTESQPHYTMLYKEKRNLTIGKTIVQYDWLTPKATKSRPPAYPVACSAPIRGLLVCFDFLPPLQKVYFLFFFTDSPVNGAIYSTNDI